MDKKTKKRIGVLSKKLSHLRQQLSGARRQMDDPDDVERLKLEVARVETELQTLKNP